MTLRIEPARQSIIVPLLLLGLLAPSTAFAQYKGDHIPGATGMQSGSQPPPGFYIGNLTFAYPTDTIKDGNGNTLTGGGTTITTSLTGASLAWVLKPTIAGGHLGGAVLLPLMANRIERNSLSVDTGAAFTDMVVQPAMLGWHSKRADTMAAYSLYLPTGKFAPGGTDNSGLGMIGQELSGNTTIFFDDTRTWTASTSLAYEWHSKKRDEDLRVGNIFTIEYAVGRSWYKRVDAPLPLIMTGGLAGYMQFKVTDDTGTAIPASLQSVPRDRVFGLGPEFDMFIPQARLSIVVRVQPEFGARVRTQGVGFTLAVAWVAKTWETH
jgi:hypothetical protein